MAENAAPRVLGFITGMSRAGTKWLAGALHRHSQVAAFGESSFWGRHYVAPSADGRYTAADLDRLLERVGTANLHSTDLRVPGPVLVREVVEGVRRDGAAPTPRDVFDAIAVAVGRSEGKPLVVEKTPHHVNWLGRIRAAYPEARIVVMMREPYGFMRSYKHQGDRKPEAVRDRFRGQYHPVACALVYRRSLTSALDALATDGVVRVDYESLARDPEATLADVQRALGLPVEDLRAPPTNTSFPAGARPELAPVDVFWMNRIAGRAIRRAGYARRPSGATPGAVLGSLFGLAGWSRRLRGLRAGYLLRWLR